MLDKCIYIYMYIYIYLNIFTCSLGFLSFCERAISTVHDFDHTWKYALLSKIRPLENS